MKDTIESKGVTLSTTSIMSIVLGLKKSTRRFVMRTLQRYVIPLVPRSIYYRKLRTYLKFEHTPPEGVIFKLAQTKDELSQAFKLIHDSYVASGYMDPHPSGMRLTKYHALPSTSTMIAVKNGKVIGTVSLVRSSYFGTPGELAYDMSFLKTEGARFAEVSALTIHPDYTKKQGVILWPLLKFTNEYAIRFFGTEYYTIVVNSQWFDFYAATWFFQPFTNKKIKYSYVKGAEGVGGYVRHRVRDAKAEEIYKDLPLEQNYYHYIYKLQFDCFQFPERKFSTISDPVMTADLLDYFFNQKSDVFASLTEIEKAVLQTMYNTEEYRKILPSTNVHSMKHRRSTSQKRFETECESKLVIGAGVSIPIQIKNISELGFGAIIPRAVRFGEEYKVEIITGANSKTVLTVHPVWKKEDGSHGFAVKNADPSWKLFISLQDQALLKVGDRQQA